MQYNLFSLSRMFINVQCFQTLIKSQTNNFRLLSVKKHLKWHFVDCCICPLRLNCSRSHRNTRIPLETTNHQRGPSPRCEAQRRAKETDSEFKKEVLKKHLNSPRIWKCVEMLSLRDLVGERVGSSIPDSCVCVSARVMMSSPSAGAIRPVISGLRHRDLRAIAALNLRCFGRIGE